MKKKKIIIKVLITLVFFTASIYYIHEKDLQVDTRLSITVKTPRKDIFRLYTGDKKPLKARVKKYFKQVDFHLPKQRRASVSRLMLGQKPGLVAIKNVKIKTSFNEQKWSGSDIKKVFKFDGKLAADKIYVKEGCFYIKSPGGEFVLPLTDEVRRTIDRMSRENFFLYFTALLLSLLLFYFIHFFHPGNLRIFLSPKIAANMALLFLVIISFPMLDGLFHIRGEIHLHPLQEKKSRTKKPAFRFDDLFRFFQGYKYYYNDNFQLRSLFIPANNFIKVRCFGISPLPSILLGKEGWIYLHKQNDRIDQIEYFRSLELFTPAELEHWRVSLEQRRDWLAKRGIRYLFVIAPNKSTIYPEFLPDSIRPVRDRSRLDQLAAYLKKHSDFSILDLRPALFAAKKERRLYRKTGSHWNSYGAFLAYREILKALSAFFPDARPMDASRLNIRVVDQSGGDLAIMLALQKNIYKDRVIEAKFKKTRARRGKHVALKDKHLWVQQSVSECPTGKLPTTLMVHDSFTNRLKPFLSEHFSRIIYLRDWGLNFFPQLIKTEKPALVIDQMAERFLLEKVLTKPKAAHRER